MKNSVWISSGLLLLSALATQTMAQQQKGSGPAIVVAETNAVKATVEEVNPSRRELKLKDEEGNTIKMTVSKDVKNLDKVKKGDEILAGYYQSAAISVNKPGETPVEAGDKEAVIVSEKGERPRGVAVKTTQVTATVEDIDHAKREVKLKDAEGNTTKIKVGDRVKRLDEVKKGDQIVARYTEALAVFVTKPDE